MNDSPLTEAELQELIADSKEGDTEAFGKLYDHFFPSVYRYAAFRLAKEVAEDVTADVFIKAWEKLHTYKMKKGVPFGAWLFRIARHSVIDSYRTHHRLEEVPESLPDTDHLNQTQTRMERNDLLLTVRQAMDQLPSRYREVLLLSFVSELSHSDIARVLHMTEGGVRILKLRALRKLETLLPPDL